MALEFKAQNRVDQGTGASRRLRRANKVPAVVYGGAAAPQAIELDHNEIYLALRKEAFHASILTLDIDGKKELVQLRDNQVHAYKALVLHIDFQRVDTSKKMHIKVPLHFINADIAPGVKLGGGIVSHVMNEIDISCLPADLPEFIEVDLKDLVAGHSIHIADLKLPNGVSVLLHGQDNPVVATILAVRGGSAEDTPAA